MVETGSFRRVVALTGSAVIAVAMTAVPASAAAADESAMAGLINQARGSAGLAPLEVYWDLADDAQGQTEAMIAQGSIFHSSSLAGVTSGWHALGENVGVGADVSQLHTAFMNSSGHRANVLGDYNYVGVGADRHEDGRLFITVIFMKGPAGLVATAEPEEEPTPEPVEEPASEPEPVAQPEPAEEKSPAPKPKQTQPASGTSTSEAPPRPAATERYEVVRGPDGSPSIVVGPWSIE